MGQMLERFSSVSEEKKNKEIDRIVEEVYKKYLEPKPKESKDKPDTSNKSNDAEISKTSDKTNDAKTSTASDKTNDPKTPSTTSDSDKSNDAKTSTASDKTTDAKTPSTTSDSDKSNAAKTSTASDKSNEAKTSKYKAKFYRAVCEIVGELNKTFGNTQFKVPSIKNLDEAFQKHHRTAEPVTKAEFQDMLQYILKTESGLFTGFGAKDALVYIFSVPAAALFAKQRFFPHAIPNDVLIPGVTSATVFALAKLNKI